MPCLGSARFVLDFPGVSVRLSLRRPRSSSRSFRISYSSSIATSTRWPPRREFSIMAAHLRSDFFEYTSGRWIFNDDLRHAERRRVFKIDELSRLAAEAVNRSPDDIVRLEKLAEGGFNRTFLITMRCGFGMVARIPYPATIPKYFAIASEVATMALLRSFGLPIPEVYRYSPMPNNAAGTEYIFMEFVQGTSLSDIWFDPGEREIISISRQLAELESKMMSIAFPAGGSLYYIEDLENAAESASWPTRPGITLDDKRFCVGPDTSLRLWYGRRSQLDLDRGPLPKQPPRGAEKELAYLRQFGRTAVAVPARKEGSLQVPGAAAVRSHRDLDRYLLLASSLSPGTQHSVISTSAIPTTTMSWFAIYDAAFATEKLDDMDETQQSGEMELYRRRLVHYHYVKNTEEYNELHYAALTDPMGVLRRRLFCHASDPWEGETLALKVALIQATKNWKKLTGGGPPCPVVFDPDDVRETMKLDAEQKEADECLEACRDVIGFGQEGWVPVEHYEEAMALSKKLKEDGLAAAESEEERAQIAAHWPFDDMDEEEYDCLAIHVIEPVYQLRNQNIEVY
ncbi:protein kinase subdomain-containing protein PKL CAK Fmp29 [Suillus placidus]|uniref:Protein kinase subdomain-containing protein PKL CAK Fmp29 n=1 Tax=Suillus placidus TaxID=48579 RepID=A0A9P7CVL8_9AGAM|nr:protein kinase subdomain-containing protein PKL CAK Fmp29 [Suillus placidus]